MRLRWRVLGHVARLPEASVCYADIGLTDDGTQAPSALGTVSGRTLPGPPRRLDNRSNAYYRELGLWWVDGAAHRPRHLAGDVGAAL